FLYFFLNDPSPPESSTLSLHDALPISRIGEWRGICFCWSSESSSGGSFFVALAGNFIALAGNGLLFSPRHVAGVNAAAKADENRDRKSTRLNSSHLGISYAVFCLKKKK